MKYWVVSILTAIIACGFGNLDTMVLASNFVFRKNLRRLGRGNTFISNFRRVYGIKGVLELLAVELVRDLLPILIGGFLFGRIEHADMGYIMAGICLCIARMWPYLYDLKGSTAFICYLITCIFIDKSAAIAALVLFAGVVWGTRYIPLGIAISAVINIVIGVLVVDDSLTLRLFIILNVLMAVHCVPALLRIRKQQEEKLSFRNDFSYKFDE